MKKIDEKLLAKCREEGYKMFLNNTELELLKLCAIGRFVPCSIAGKYDLQELRTPLINSFIRKEYIRL